MSGRTHDVTISGFDLDRLEAELAKALRERDEAMSKVDRYRALTTDLAIQRNEAWEALQVLVRGRF